MELNKKDEKYIQEELKFLKKCDVDCSKIIDTFEGRILKLKNPYLSYWFAAEFEDANVRAHEQVIIDSKNLDYCYYFAQNVPKADVKKLSKVIVESGNINFNRTFLFNFSNCDKIAHINFLAENDEYLSLVDYLDSKRGQQLKKDEDVTKRLSELFIKTKDPYLNYEIAKKLTTRVDIYKHAKVVMNNEAHVSFGGVNDITYYSYLFALDVPVAPIEELRQTVIKKGEAEENYYFAKNITSTDEEFKAHRDAVFKSGNEETIKEFKELILERYPEEMYKERIKKLTKFMDKCIEEQ